jgi:hypothetical protein
MKQTAIFFVPLAMGSLWLNAPAIDGDARAARGSLLKWQIAGLGACVAFFFAAMAWVSCVGSMLNLVNPARFAAYRSAMQPLSLQTYDRTETVRRLMRFRNSTWQLNGGVCLAFICYFLNPVLRRQPRRFATFVAFFWGAAASVVAGGRYFGHYFVLLLPFACLLVGASLGAPPPGADGRRRTFARAAVAIVVGVLGVYESWPQIALARDVVVNYRATGSPLSAALLHRNTRQAIEPHFQSYWIGELEWQQTYRLLSRFLAERLRPGETIWCYDYMATMHHYTQTFAPTRHQEHFEVVTRMSNYYAGLWFTGDSAVVRTARRELMAELAARPPRFLLRYAYDCPWDVTERVREQPDFPRNVYHESMGVCFPKAELFPELAAFLDANYRLLPQNLTNAINVYESK